MSRPRSVFSKNGYLTSPTRDTPADSLHTTGLISDLFDVRNSEISHRDALEQAKAEHDRVRERALRVFEMHELEVERQRIVDAQAKEQERLKREAAVLAEKQRLEALQKAKAPTPPPLPKVEPVAVKKEKELVPPTQETKKEEVSPAPKEATKQAEKAVPVAAPKKEESTEPAPAKSETKSIFGAPLSAAPAASVGFGKPSFGSAAAPAGLKSSDAPKPAGGLFGNPSGASASAAAVKPAAASVASKTAPTPAAAAVPKPAPAAASPVIQADPTYFPHNQRYVEIHKKLKELRKAVESAAAVPGSPLKGKVGDMRREIRKSMGQLTEGAGSNKVQLVKIRAVLKSSLDGTHVSPMVDVKDYVAEVPPAKAEDVHKGDQLPSLFLYLLNIFSKAVINQFINECGANPKAADPIGVMFSQIFSDKDYHWHGFTLADIFFAKLRIVCPVLFGIRGNERAAEGRLAIGWKRDGPDFLPEQAHWDRMSGLGAGFGAITLRDFSKTARVTPAPPVIYWTALAALVNTPPAQVSGTQLVVLKAIIEGHTTRFIQFYGNAAMAVLKRVLVEFPQKVAKSPSQEALAVLADRLLKDEGLRFV